MGHLEGDTVMGRDGRHCLLTLVDRKTRKLRIIKLRARQASEVNKALIREVREGRVKLKSLPDQQEGSADIGTWLTI